MRYLIFGGTAYYAAGGARDLITGVDDYHHAKDYAENIIGMTGDVPNPEGEEEVCMIEWSHVLDLETKSIIAKFGDRQYGRSWSGDMVSKLEL